MELVKKSNLPPNTIVKTRDEAVRKYMDGLSGNTAEQAVALTRLCDDMDHIGYMRGVAEGGAAAREGAVMAINTVFGARNG